MLCKPVFTLSRLSCYGQLLDQLSVALLSHATVFLQCYSLLLLYFGQINDDDDGGLHVNGSYVSICK